MLTLKIDLTLNQVHICGSERKVKDTLPLVFVFSFLVEVFQLLVLKIVW